MTKYRVHCISNVVASFRTSNEIIVDESLFNVSLLFPKYWKKSMRIIMKIVFSLDSKFLKKLSTNFEHA